MSSQLRNPLLWKAEDRPRDTDGTDNAQAMIEDWRCHAAHAFLVLLHVGRVAANANALQLYPQFSRVGDRMWGPRFETVGKNRGELVLAGVSKDCLADAGAVERHALAHAGPHLEGVRALDLLHIDDMRAARHTEMNRLLCAVGQRAEHGEH